MIKKPQYNVFDLSTYTLYSSTMNKKFIEKKAYDLHKRIWQERNSLWPEGAPKPINMLEPEVAARVLDVNFDMGETLGPFGYAGDSFEVAGSIDRQRKTILVSGRFPFYVTRFTGAHEIGH